MANRQLGTFICNNCGEEVHRKAKVCPNCGADDETAWKEGANRPIYLTQEDDDFDYDEFVRTEIHGKKPKNKRWWIPVTAIVLLLAFAYAVLRRWLF
jgi:predicted amidophosphoribosyltransferase